MVGIIERWDNKKVIREGWTRFAVRPDCRATGRSIMEKYKLWFIKNGRGRSMFWVVDHSRYFTIAFSDMSDCVLFRLTFTDVPIGIVPQPYAHEQYQISE